MDRSDIEFEPKPRSVLPRFAGPPSFMGLPWIEPDSHAAAKVDIGLIGVPWDGGTTNRPGARHGPRQLRDLSTMIRAVHPVSGINPFRLVNCADLGDSPVNPADLLDTLSHVGAFFRDIIDRGIAPMSAGGDHLVTLPILRALSGDGPLGMVHFDAHTDLNDEYFNGQRYTHGTPFRRAVEEGLLDAKRVIQIGIRGTMYDGSDIEWGRAQGIRIVTIEEYFDLGPDAVMDEARAIVGEGRTYVSFDIDGIDPTYAPGTGTPEIGGYTTFEAQKMVRRLQGLNLVGADLVEVSPPFDPSGNTAWVGASLMFELLCVLADAVNRRRPA